MQCQMCFWAVWSEESPLDSVIQDSGLFCCESDLVAVRQLSIVVKRTSESWWVTLVAFQTLCFRSCRYQHRLCCSSTAFFFFLLVLEVCAAGTGRGLGKHQCHCWFWELRVETDCTGPLWGFLSNKPKVKSSFIKSNMLGRPFEGVNSGWEQVMCHTGCTSHTQEMRWNGGVALCQYLCLFYLFKCLLFLLNIFVVYFWNTVLTIWR